MSQSTGQTNAMLPMSRQSVCDEAAGHAEIGMAAAPRFSNQSPFDIINGVAYKRNGFFSIDCVISFLYGSPEVSHYKGWAERRIVAFPVTLRARRTIDGQDAAAD